MWYKRAESQKRFTFFDSGASLAGAFSGLLASAIGKLDGKLGQHGWRWIFWIEGAFTCLLAFAAFFLVADFPESSSWLKDGERSYVIMRLAEDQGASRIEEKVKVKSVLKAFKNWKMIPVPFMFFGPGVSGYGKNSAFANVTYPF